MKLPTGLALILVGVTSTATAQTKPEERTGRVSYTGKNDPKPDAARRDGDWVEISTPTPAKHGTEFVVVGKDAGSFARLRLDATKGKVIVLRVKVFFEDGKIQIADLDKRLDEHRKSVFVDLKQIAPIDRVVITTETYTNGSYSVYGTAGQPGVAAR